MPDSADLEPDDQTSSAAIPALAPVAEAPEPPQPAWDRGAALLADLYGLMDKHCRDNPVSRSTHAANVINGALGAAITTISAALAGIQE